MEKSSSNSKSCNFNRKENTAKKEDLSQDNTR